MKTSEIIECLEGREPWLNLEARHNSALSKMAQRKDGALTSSEIGLKFDKAIILNDRRIKNRKLEADELWVFANLVTLCGFDTNSDETEDHLYFMCKMSETYNKLVKSTPKRCVFPQFTQALCVKSKFEFLVSEHSKKRLER